MNGSNAGNGRRPRAGVRPKTRFGRSDVSHALILFMLRAASAADIWSEPEVFRGDGLP
jgi:hypothetical protein